MTRGHHIADGQHATNESGFSLLETLVALAILSLISLASFQSLTQLTGLSARASVATERTVDAVLDRAVFTDLVANIVPGWQAETQGAFRGDAAGFAAQSGRVPGTREGLVPFVLAATDDGLFVRTSDTVTALSPLKARIAYLGTDAAWRSSWPPKGPIPFGPPDAVANTAGEGDHRFAPAPILPAALRVDFADGSSWLAALRSDPLLPPAIADTVQ